MCNIFFLHKNWVGMLGGQVTVTHRNRSYYFPPFTLYIESSTISLSETYHKIPIITTTTLNPTHSRVLFYCQFSVFVTSLTLYNSFSVPWIWSLIRYHTAPSVETMPLFWYLMLNNCWANKWLYSSLLRVYGNINLNYYHFFSTWSNW